MIKLHLPLSPSSNSLYPGRIRRHKSKEYESWIREARFMLMEQWRGVTVNYPVCVTYKIGKPSNRRMDIANREKALGDILVSCGVLKDDSLIHRLVMEWGDIEGCDVEIEPYFKSSNSTPTTS